MLAKIKEKYLTYQTPIVWRNVLGIFGLHILTILGIIYSVPQGRLSAWIFAYLYSYIGALSITVGAHRLWTHKTYKAKLPLRIVLMICYCSSGMYSIVQWARDHRLHHKCADTEADPHNANRGFFFSHCGWLMLKRTKESKEMGKLIDLSDLWEDPVVRFQQKYFIPLLLFFHVIFPVYIVGHLIMGYDLLPCFYGLFAIRYCLILHITWSVNSITHLYGYKPYNKSIMAVQNKFAAFLTGGEGWHNYHHVFPWDYKIGEFSQGYQYGTLFIDLFYALGLAYDLKSAPREMVKKVLLKADKMNDPKFEVFESELYKKTNIDEAKKVT